MSRTGRNEPCQCGSGKKYKRCHGSPVAPRRPVIPAIATALARSEAERVQRERQQGLGKPIISAELNGARFVAVKNRLLYSKKWCTFEDFLFDYIRMALGSEWGNTEIAKPAEERHPIVIWYQKVCVYQKEQIKEPGKVHTSLMTGGVGAYLHLAYDLYSLDHNAELQSKLLARLRNRDMFSGARYEVYVAATFVPPASISNSRTRTTEAQRIVSLQRRTAGLARSFPSRRNVEKAIGFGLELSSTTRLRRTRITPASFLST